MELIYSYTRAEAIEDGVLVSIDEKISNSFGFKVPVAITQAVYNAYVYWDAEDDNRQTLQDKSGRLKDILCMCSFYLSISNARRESADWLIFTVSVIPRDTTHTSCTVKDIKLKAIIGPDDDLKPVITIMLPSED